MNSDHESSIDEVRAVGYLAGVSDPLIIGANYYEDAPTEWLTTHRAQLREIRKARPSAVFLGDSITKGWLGQGAESWNRHFEPLPAYCLGLGGDRAQHLHWRVEQGVLGEIDPDVVVIMAGVNNLWYDADSFGLDRVKESLRRLGCAVRAASPRAGIIQISILPALSDPSHSVRDHARQVNRFLEATVAEFDGEFLDVHDDFLSEGAAIDWDLMPDYVHPSAEGYAIIAEKLAPRVESIVASKSAPSAGGRR